MTDEITIQVIAENDEKVISAVRENEENEINAEEEPVVLEVNTDYDRLTNKPQINGHDLVGNQISEDIGIIIPKDVSELTNDAGYITNDALEGYAQTTDLSTVALSGNYSDLINKPTIPTVPTKLSSFTDDLGTTPTHSHSQYALSSDIPTVPTKLSAFSDDLGSSPTHTHSQYLTEHQDISGKADVFEVGYGLDMTGQKLTNPFSIEYIVGTQAESTNAWKGVTADTSLRAGKVIAYYLPVAGTSTAATLQLTFPDGTKTTAIELRRTGTSTVTTQFAAGNVLLMIYDGTYWKVSAYYDTNTNTIGYQLRTNSGSLPMTDIVYRYRILFTSADNTHFVPSNKSTSTNATAERDVITTPINPFGPIVYYGTTSSVSAGSNPSASYLWQQYGITLGYSFNRTGAALVLEFPKPIYVKCSLQSDGSAIIDPDNPYVQALPSSEDNKIYIYLGIAYSATSIELRLEHPVYQYKNGKICLYTGN